MANHRGVGGESSWNVKRQHVADYVDIKRIHTEEVVQLCAVKRHRLTLPSLPSATNSFFLLSAPFKQQLLFLSCPCFHSHPIHKFSLTARSPQTRASIVLPEMPWSPRPGMQCAYVCVCVCVPFREQLSHSAITCCTAESPRQLSPCLSFIYTTVS